MGGGPNTSSEEKNSSQQTSTHQTSSSEEPPAKSDPAESQRIDDGTIPDFIYGGPFISSNKMADFIDTTTPINFPLHGCFKKSYAFYSLKERMPVILTKIIDYCSRDQVRIAAQHGTTTADVIQYIQYITKLKNDLVTNKRYDKLEVVSREASEWNDWIEQVETPTFFMNTWLGSECFIYRRLREGCEISKGLQNFDPFAVQKEEAFVQSLESMCVVASKLMAMLGKTDNHKKRQDLITLFNLCLWSNKCDLSHTCGAPVKLGSHGTADPVVDRNSEAKGNGEDVSTPVSSLIDPFQMINELKDNVVVDESGKFVDQLFKRVEAMLKSNQNAPEGVPSEQVQAEEDAENWDPEATCLSKVTGPNAVYFDIVCDNSGYELFTDLCLAQYLISQEIVQKVRFHLKNMPWFISDVTPRDFKYILQACASASYSKTAAEASILTEACYCEDDIAESLQALGKQWLQYLADGTFIVMHDDYWTLPHPYKDMKERDSYLYRKLQLATGIMFKGDLNYRKLLADVNVISTQGFETSLQGFHPAPLLAVRTVKSDLICGLPKGKMEALNNVDPKWLETGDYGIIQFSSKVDPLKVADRPCPNYGQTVHGTSCPPTTEGT